MRIRHILYNNRECLKWFTQRDNNLRFVCDSAYLPVLKEANTTDALENVIKENDLQINEIAHSCLESILSSYDEMTFFTSKSFQNGYEDCCKALNEAASGS